MLGLLMDLVNVHRLHDWLACSRPWESHWAWPWPEDTLKGEEKDGEKDPTCCDPEAQRERRKLEKGTTAKLSGAPSEEGEDRPNTQQPRTTGAAQARRERRTLADGRQGTPQLVGPTWKQKKRQRRLANQKAREQDQ